MGGYDREEDTPIMGDVVEIQTLGLGGETDRSFLWYDIPGTLTGWIEPEAGNAPLERDDVTVFPGEGLWVIADGTTWTLKTSGEVATTADIVTPLQDRGRLVVNPTPVNIDAANVYINGYDPEEDTPIMGDLVEMQTLGAGGETDRSFLWYDIPGTLTGWIEPEAGNAPLEEDDVIATPGQGFWVICDGNGFNFCWPKVEL